MLSFYYHIAKTEHLLLNINYPYVHLSKVSFFPFIPNVLFCMQNKILSQTVSENARLELNSKYTSGSENNGNPAGGSTNGNNIVSDDDFELWDHSGFMLRNDADDPIMNGKLVYIFIINFNFNKI